MDGEGEPDLLLEMQGKDGSGSKLALEQDDMAEMEQMLKSGGVFAHKSGNALAQDESGLEDKNELDADAEGNESDLGFELQHDNSQLQMDSPGQNTLVQNQINQLTDLDPALEDLAGQLPADLEDVQIDGEHAVYEDGAQSDSHIDIDNLTESQLEALQLQAQQQEVSGEMAEDDEEEDDVIDVDNPDDLAKKGLRRIQIEGDDQEYLLDNEGNIYNLQGEFVGTTGEDDDDQGEAEEQFEDGQE